jgi:hypothetical protein
MSSAALAMTNSTVSSPFTTSLAGTLQRKCDCGSSAGVTGECEECRKKRILLQPKLTIGRSGDAFEAEADVASRRVMDGSPAEVLLRTPPSHGGAPGHSTAADSGHGDSLCQRNVSDGERAFDSSAIHDTLTSSGQPLNRSTRDHMESHFGFDFSRVRIHASDRAAI